ncbi:MAG TPA: cytochrome c oxidase subunit II [Pirellulales bacterium]|jgi:cytochrome c oxidase subunit 2|nr:cytochrome c oxidase subunit II [Pirellulales bacterium]
MGSAAFGGWGLWGSENLSIFAPASPSAASIRELALLVLAITALIFVVVEGVLFYCTWRFRRRSDSDTDAEPPQIYGSKPIEVAWTVAPALIVFTLVLVTTRTMWEVEIPQPAPAADENALFVTVTGKQWWWELAYDHYQGRALAFVTANELHVPASSEGAAHRVYLTLKSADVCHSFWVPRLAGKTDLIPGVENHMWFETQQPGLFLGQCAEYCGTQHAGMLLRVVVDEPADFERWLAAQQQAAAEKPEAADGRTAFLAESCVNCHRVRGTAAQGSYAPDLTHLMSRQTLASGLVPNSPENLRRWILDPQQVKSGCLMPAFGLAPEKRERIVDYLLSLE